MEALYQEPHSHPSRLDTGRIFDWSGTGFPWFLWVIVALSRIIFILRNERAVWIRGQGLT